jgi:RNA polymerase sigma-70 factor (ECF subfamily)
MTPDGALRARRAAERAAREAYGKLVARLAKHTRDIAAAEDALGHAFSQALATWPATGVPAAPEAWLTAVARNAARDAARRAATRSAGEATLLLLAEERDEAAAVPDDRLGLILAASHPAIAPAVHAPLILQAVFGVTAEEMAGAFLVSPAALGQRLVRAKTKIKAAGIPFETAPADTPARLARALDAIYALYTVAAAAPPSASAADRAADALHLARLVARLADTAEAHGLAALLAFSEARAPARRDADGRFVPLSQQETALWDGALIAEAEAALVRASRARTPGPYQLEAAIQSVHADRRRTGRTHWPAIALFYDALAALSPSVGAAVARAAAHAEADGPAAGLALLDAIPADRVADYQPYWAVRAHLAVRLGEPAAEAFAQAIALATDAAVKAHLTALRDGG